MFLISSFLFLTFSVVSVLCVNNVPKRISKRRELRESSIQSQSQSTSEEFSLDMQCDGKSPSDCLNYMQNFVSDHINVNREYNRQNIPVLLPYNKLDPPVEGDLYDTIESELLVTFHDLISVNTVDGYVTLSIFIDMYWRDELLNWNTSKTLDNAELVVSPSLIWIPDFVIYNSVGGASMEEPAVFLYADGYVNYSGKGVVKVACTFDLLDFPFDTQTCSPEFGSWAYPDYQLTFSDVSIDIDSNFNNLGWSVDHVGSKTTVKTYWDVYDYTFAVYDITISRYSDYYVRSAVLPCLISSVIVLLGLWVNNIASRLSLSVTGLLTNIAVQWTVARELPITNGQVWLSSFLTLSMVFIALVCLQCFASGYMDSQKVDKPVPRWMKRVIDFSLLRIPYLTEDPLDDEIEEDARLKTGQLKEESGSIAMQVLNPLSEAGGEGKKETTGANSESYTAELLANQKRKYTWQRGSRSFDRICRIIIPMIFAVFIGVELGTL